MQQQTEDPRAGTEGTRWKAEQPALGLGFLKRLFEVGCPGNIKCELRVMSFSLGSPVFLRGGEEECFLS